MLKTLGISIAFLSLIPNVLNATTLTPFRPPKVVISPEMRAVANRLLAKAFVNLGTREAGAVVVDWILPVAVTVNALALVGFVWDISGGVYQLFVKPMADQHHQKVFFKKLNDPELIAQANRFCPTGEPVCQLRLQTEDDFVPMIPGNLQSFNTLKSERAKNEAMEAQRERYEKELYENLKAAGYKRTYETWRLFSDTQKYYLTKYYLGLLVLSLLDRLSNFQRDASQLRPDLESEIGIVSQLDPAIYPWFGEIQLYLNVIYMSATRGVWDATMTWQSARLVVDKLKEGGGNYLTFLETSLQETVTSGNLKETISSLKESLDKMNSEAKRIYDMTELILRLGY